MNAMLFRDLARRGRM